MKLNSNVIAIGIAALIAAIPGISNAKVVRHASVASAQVVVRDNDVAPVLAVLVGGLVLASAIHASQHCEPVVVAALPCPPRYDDCDDRRGGGYQDHDRGGWHQDRGGYDGRGGREHDHGRGHGRGHERGWERHDD